MKCIYRVSPEEMKLAYRCRVYSTNGDGPLTHHLAVEKEDGSPLRFEDGEPVRWSGRTYGQFLTNAGFMAEKYNLPGETDASGIIRE